MPHSCIGNYMTYDTITVYNNWNYYAITIITINAFLKSLINDHPKTRNLFNKSIIYFSDGSTVQYKNYKNFTNLLMHGKDFGMEAKYHFFATCHRKNLSDGVGGAINRFATHANLSRKVQNQIFNPYQIYGFHKSDIHNLTCFWRQAPSSNNFKTFVLQNSKD